MPMRLTWQNTLNSKFDYNLEILIFQNLGGNALSFYCLQHDFLKSSEISPKRKDVLIDISYVQGSKTLGIDYAKKVMAPMARNIIGLFLYICTKNI
jgi:hypothetical protein